MGRDWTTERDVVPLWSRAPKPPGDAPDVRLWTYARLRPLLARAADEVPLETAERRVLMLVNPPFDDRTTPTVQANLQLVRPGERAAPHRHSMTAVRLGIEGTGLVTTVDEQRVPIEPGDLVLTPSGTWHAHDHDGATDVVWLDVLDRPFVEGIGLDFFGRPGPDAAVAPARGGSGRTATVRFPWADMRARLDAVATTDGIARLPYLTSEQVHPLATIAIEAIRLAPGARLDLPAGAASTVVHAVAGGGALHAGEQRLDWSEHDTFVVPAHRDATVVGNDSESYLVAFTDTPIVALVECPT